MSDSKTSVDLEAIKKEVERVKKLLKDTEKEREKRLKKRVQLRKKLGRHATD